MGYAGDVTQEALRCGLDGRGADGHGGRLLLASALVLDRQLLARGLVPDQRDQFVAVLQHDAVDLQDDVAGLETRLGGGAVRLDRLDALLGLGRDLHAGALEGRVDGDADPRLLGRTGGDQLLGDPARVVTGMANPSPMLPLWPPTDLPRVAIAELTPMTSPLVLTSGPPSYPG